MEGYFSSSNRLLQVITSINDVVVSLLSEMYNTSHFLGTVFLWLTGKNIDDYPSTDHLYYTTKPSINDVVSNNAMNNMNTILLISFLTRLKPEVKDD